MNRENNHMIEMTQYEEEGYKTLVSFDGWRVAVLNYIDELEPDRIDNFQKHDHTDEVFVLLDGHCILFTADCNEAGEIVDIRCLDMKKNTLYNVKQGVYHTHTLTKNAKVLIVENRDTSDDNSPKIMIGEKERMTLCQLTSERWSNRPDAV